MNLGLTSGDATGALALAKQSTRTERNPAALELVLEAHCQLKQKKSAKILLDRTIKMLSKNGLKESTRFYQHIKYKKILALAHLRLDLLPKLGSKSNFWVKAKDVLKKEQSRQQPKQLLLR